jgi:RNA polymerase sigma-70 factor (ECF subfamily)
MTFFPLSQLTDEALAQEARCSAAAFAELYRRHFRRVYNYQLARTGNIQDAEDLTSQTFMAALEGIAGYRAQGSPAAWLLGIAHRKMVDHYRRRKPQAALDEAQDLPHPAMATEEQAERRTLLLEVGAAMQSLPAERAEGLALRIFGGLSAAEVGAVMGKSEAAVKMLVHRALQDLRERLPLSFEEER